MQNQPKDAVQPSPKKQPQQAPDQRMAQMKKVADGLDRMLVGQCLELVSVLSIPVMIGAGYDLAEGGVISMCIGFIGILVTMAGVYELSHAPKESGVRGFCWLVILTYVGSVAGGFLLPFISGLGQFMGIIVALCARIPISFFTALAVSTLGKYLNITHLKRIGLAFFVFTFLLVFVVGVIKLLLLVEIANVSKDSQEAILRWTVWGTVLDALWSLALVITVFVFSRTIHQRIRLVS